MGFTVVAFVFTPGTGLGWLAVFAASAHERRIPQVVHAFFVWLLAWQPEQTHTRGG